MKSGAASAIANDKHPSSDDLGQVMHRVARDWTQDLSMHSVFGSLLGLPYFTCFYSQAHKIRVATHWSTVIDITSIEDKPMTAGMHALYLNTWESIRLPANFFLLQSHHARTFSSIKLLHVHRPRPPDNAEIFNLL